MYPFEAMPQLFASLLIYNVYLKVTCEQFGVAYLFAWLAYIC